MELIKTTARMMAREIFYRWRIPFILWELGIRNPVIFIRGMRTLNQGVLGAVEKDEKQRRNRVAKSF